MVLPRDEEKAEALVYDKLRMSREPLAYSSGLLPHLVPHYRTDLKQITLPAWAVESPPHNVVLHELGHALDFLYSSEGIVLSELPQVAEVLRKVPPLDRHCLEQDTLKENNLEQFATSFEAFFNETEVEKKHEFFHTVDDIDISFVALMCKYFVDPFKG